VVFNVVTDLDDKVEDDEGEGEELKPSWLYLFQPQVHILF
jgi:hypothetical protein